MRKQLRSTIKSTVIKMSEPKWQASGGTNVVTTVAPVGQLVNGLSQGTSRGERVGTKIRARSLFANFSIQCTTPAARCRLMFVCDRQPNTAVPTLTDMFVSANAAEWYFSAFNLNYVGKTKRYQILWDRQVALNIGGGNADSPTRVFRKKFKRLGANCYYNDAGTNTITSISRNSFYIMAFTDQAVPGSIVVGIQWQFIFADL